MSTAATGRVQVWGKRVVVVAPMLVGLVFLALAVLQTQRGLSTPQVKLENCAAYYIGDPMAKDCPARNAAAAHAAAVLQAQAGSALPVAWILAVVVSLAAISLSIYFNSHWDGIWKMWGRR